MSLPRTLICLLLLLPAVLLPAGVAWAQAPNWSINPSNFEQSMNIVGAVRKDGVEDTQPTDMVGAFVDGELRGWGEPIEVSGRWLFFLTVYANTSGETLTFQVYDTPVDRVRPLAETLTFVSNGVEGSSSQPFEWNTSDATAAERGLSGPAAFVLHGAYPNPFNPATIMPFDVPQAAAVQLVVYDGLGREVVRLVDEVVAPGRHAARFDAAGLPSGMYVVRMTSADGFTQALQILLTK